MNNSPRANVFLAGKVNFGQAMYRNMYRSLELLVRTLIWPGHLGARSFGFFELYPSSLSKSAEFVSLAGKALLVVYPMLSYSYDLPLELEFCGKCCVFFFVF